MYNDKKSTNKHTYTHSFIIEIHLFTLGVDIQIVKSSKILEKAREMCDKILFWNSHIIVNACL